MIAFVYSLYSLFHYSHGVIDRNISTIYISKMKETFCYLQLDWLEKGCEDAS